MVVPSRDRLFHTAYSDWSWDGTPTFVTTDAAYHSWHLVFDKILREVEQKRLLPALEQLVTGLLDNAVAALEAGGHADLATALSELAAELAPEGYPAIHHSQSFRDAYQPAYRVVVAELAIAAGWCPGHAAEADPERDRRRHGSPDRD